MATFFIQFQLPFCLSLWLFSFDIFVHLEVIHTSRGANTCNDCECLFNFHQAAAPDICPVCKSSNIERIQNELDFKLSEVKIVNERINDLTQSLNNSNKSTFEIMGNPNSQELSQILVCVGLAQNFAALRAFSVPVPKVANFVLLCTNSGKFSRRDFISLGL